MRYRATIKWLDNQEIVDDMILKIGDIEEDDDDIFFYLEDEKEIESFKKEGSHEWVIINIKKEDYGKHELLQV
tara:strand:- start:62 stop:280 length:219 start_codon:yes stop_codon:yes gene_type:complete